MGEGRKDFERGFVLAAVYLAQWGENQLAGWLLAEAGRTTVESLKALGVEDDDIDDLRGELQDTARPTPSKDKADG